MSRATSFSYLSRDDDFFGLPGRVGFSKHYTKNQLPLQIISTIGQFNKSNEPICQDETTPTPDERDAVVTALGSLILML